MLQSALSRLLPYGAILSFMLGLSSQADEVASPKLPQLVRPIDLYYPEPARRLNQQGRVLVEFQISRKGRAVDATIVSAEPQKVFDRVVTEYMRAVEYSVPGDWEASGGSHHKYRISFVFLLRPCREGEPCEEPAGFPADTSVTVTGSPLAPRRGTE